MNTAKIFQNGRSQAVRLPKEFRFDGNEVFVHKVGNAVVLLPVQHSWDTLFESLGQFSEDFMSDGRQQPLAQERDFSCFDRD
ncbi:MAG: type II toxin-antitoxin system VapB family antitoxin [Mariprofundus sp.]|nr:type II toxin-antitoxin system VapB family antitoxin [Mariprofundus sp.]